MKNPIIKSIFLVLSFVLFAIHNGYGQAPEKMTYQAVIRNAAGALISNTTVGVQVSILQGSATGIPVFTETHSSSTNANGLLTLVIGSQTALTIDWANGPYFIKIDTDPNGGTNYTISGSSELLSVPYALHAKTSEDAFSGDYNDLTNAPTIPTVPTNVSAFTNDAGYLTSFNETDPVFNASLAADITAADTANWNDHFSGDYNDLTNTPTIPTVPTNVSAFTNDAGYLTSFTETDPDFNASVAAGITAADTASWNNQLTQAWGLSGNSGTTGSNFIGTTSNQALIFKVNNENAGLLESTGRTHFGYRAGEGNSNSNSTAVGMYALSNSNTGDRNTGIGNKSLMSNTGGSRNTALGSESMQSNTTGNWNTAIGDNTLSFNTVGTHNSAFGALALQYNTSGSGNVAGGYGALTLLTNGYSNTGIGMYANRSLIDGNNNVALGYESGYNNTSGSGNIFIGYQAGYNETGSNKLYIANSSTNPPLIYGDFTSGNVGIGTNNPTERLYVIGNIGDGRIATFNNTYDEKFITMGEVLTDNGGYIKYKQSANYTGIGVHGHTEQLVVKGNGNVGIGTTNPQKRLHVTTTSDDWGARIDGYNSGGSAIGGVVIGSRADNKGAINGVTSAGGPADLSLNSEGGNVGINTTSPTYKLDVSGDINFTGNLRKNGTPIVMDGSETIINAGSDITITGNGTTATPYVINAAKPKFYLGQDTLGGIVFYIYLDANGDQRGLIVSKTETTGNWSAVTGYYGADRTYDGSYNMPFLTNSTAKDWVTANFSNEWYIPSIDELLILFNARMHVNKALHFGGSTQLSFNNSYWSSFEYDSTAGMYLHFSNASTGAALKSTDMLVRAVRTF